MRTMYREMFGEVRASERLKKEVIDMTKQERTQVVKKVSVSFLIAAALAVLLAGTALAAAIGVPQTLQEWFDRQWAEANDGKEMPKEQAALIESLVQPVNATAASKGVSVTLDSVTPGEGGLWLLFKVKGTEQMQKNRWQFGSFDLTGEPMEKEIKDESLSFTVHTSSMRELGVTEDGTQVFLMLYGAPKGVNFLEGGDLEFRLRDVMVWGEPPKSGMESPMLESVEARWILPFTLAPTQTPPALTAKSARVPCFHTAAEDPPAPIEIRDLRVTATGVSFLEPAWKDTGTRSYVTSDVALQLKGGMEIPVSASGPLGSASPGGTYTRFWELPVDLSKAESIRFGDVVVPLEQPKK